MLWYLRLRIFQVSLILITVAYIISAAVSANCAIVTGFGIIKPTGYSMCSVTKRGGKHKRCECMWNRGGIRGKRKGEGVVTLAAMCILDFDWGKLSEPSSFLAWWRLDGSLSLSFSLLVRWYRLARWATDCWFVWTAWNGLKAENLCMCESESVCLYAW